MTVIISGTDGVSDVDGTAGTPALRGTDANTGIFFGTDIVGVSTGGSERVRVDASGNVGIGTNAPGVGLAVQGTTADAVTIQLKQNAAGGQDYRITSRDDGSLRFNNDTAGAERMRITAAGNVGIGTSSPAQRLVVSSVDPGFTSINLVNTSAGGGNFNIATTGADGAFGASAGALVVRDSNAGVTRMVIDSAGNLLVGGRTDLLNTLSGGTVIQGANNNLFVNRRDTTSSASHFLFRNPNGEVGSISTSGSATTYATSSDYRLKKNITPMTGALAKVALLKPCTYTWKVDGSNGQGFIAHELAEVEPGCVTGEKDAVDAEGNPQYQGIDTSFLVATLTAAIQELKAINDAQAQTIESLTARIAALEVQ